MDNSGKSEVLIEAIQMVDFLEMERLVEDIRASYIQIQPIT